jgi:4,5-dihydroxyphthalate decarboxylase
MTQTVLQAALGRTRQAAALREGRIASELLRLEFADMPVINRAFAPMVRTLAYDVSEMAIATFLQARTSDVPLVLLPVTMAARFQQGALLCRTGSDIAGPADLAGRRIGVRAYSQTTGMWLRGILSDEFSVRPERVAWTTFEDAHVAGIFDPPWAARAPDGSDMMAMLQEGALDAVIVGNDVPDDPGLRTVFANPAAAADAFWDRHGFVPVNHLVTVRRDVLERRPELAAELVRLFRAARAELALPADGRDPLPSGREALRPALALALRYSTAQGMLPRPLGLEEVWDGLPPEVE